MVLHGLGRGLVLEDRLADDVTSPSIVRGSAVANLTHDDALDFLAIAAKAGVRTTITTYPLEHANPALDDLRHGRFQGAAVLVP